MNITSLYPRALQTCANPIPVLPAVPSTTVPPGFSLTSLLAPGFTTMKASNSQSLLLSVLDDPKRRPVFHTPAWVLPLSLTQNLASRLLRERLEQDLRKT